MLERSLVPRQVLRGQPADLDLTVYQDGDQTDIGAFTVGITDLAGNEVVPSGSPVTDGSDGTYTFTLAAHTDLDLLTAIWTEAAGTSFATTVEIIGGHLFTEAAARAFHRGRLDDDIKYPDDEIAAARGRVTDKMEADTGISWVPRYRRAHLRGNGYRRLPLAAAVHTEGPSGGEGADKDLITLLQVTVNGEVVTDVTADDRNLYRSYWPPTLDAAPNIIVDYEYGRPHVMSEADEMGKLLLVNYLPAKRTSDQATQVTNEFGTLSWEPENNGRPSSIPRYNAWVRSHNMAFGIA